MHDNYLLTIVIYFRTVHSTFIYRMIALVSQLYVSLRYFNNIFFFLSFLESPLPTYYLFQD